MPQMEQPLLPGGGSSSRPGSPLLSAPASRPHKYRNVAIGLLTLLVAAGITALIIVFAQDPFKERAFIESVTTENIMEHLKKFSKIADENNFSRSVVNGYNASAEYVIATLNKYSSFYNVYTQPLLVPVFLRLASPTMSLSLSAGASQVVFNNDIDFMQINYGGNATASHAALEPVFIPNNGCRPDDWRVVEGKPEGSVVAFVSTASGCSYYDKSVLAEARPEVAATVIHRGDNDKALALPSTRVRKTGWLAGDSLLQKGVFGASFALANAVRAGVQLGSASLQLNYSSVVTIESTYNVIAESKAGRIDRIAVFGSHLDSVPEGPGLNDNGSGSAMNLELAIRFAKIVKPSNQVRFCWWAAEEIGLLGSYHYVAQLSDDEATRHVAALNFDMVASPNGYRGVHNGTLTPPGTDVETVRRSNVITNLFARAFTNANPTQDFLSIDTLAGSDFLPFLIGNPNGIQIPAGGLATGASSLRSEALRTRFGGIANAAFDPCYHRSCDTIENINEELLGECAAASAAAIYNLATSYPF